MGRLEDIVERNKHPRRYRKMKFPYGAALSMLVLVVLVLMMFTDLAAPKQPPSNSAGHDKTRVDGVLLRKVPVRDAAPD